MTLVSLSAVERAYGDLIVFSDVSLRVDERDRIGIIGDNGTGKTTLLKVIRGEDPPDQGQRTAKRDVRIAWTSQIPDLPAGATILEAAHASFADLERMERELREIEDTMARNPDDERLAKRHDRIHAEFENAGGYARERLAEQTLLGLGFQDDALNKSVDVLSGGEKVRIALARAMLRPCDLLVLDEPTNHLDLEGIAFLEEWLKSRGIAFLVVSHDRRFLDRVCESILEVDNGTVTRYRGNYSAYKEQKERELKTALREYEKQEDYFAKEMAYIRKHMGSRWTAQAKGRLKRLERVRRLAKPRNAQRGMKLALNDARGLQGQCVLEAEGLAMSFGERQLFANVGFRVYHGDRVGILGRNGTGKSTLLRLIAGASTAKAGSIERAKRLRIAYFSQEMEDLPSSGTVLASMQHLMPNWTEGECRDHLALFVFYADDVDKDVQTLSGGEKRRLCLARLVLAPADIYLLDEPTNHLDITTRESLEGALDEFGGTVVIVSHDRFFLAQSVRKIFELTASGIGVHDGGIDRYEEVVAERRRAAESAKRERRTPASQPTNPKPASAKSDSPGKIRNPYAFEQLEKRIFALEEELETIHTKLSDAESWKQPDELKDMQTRQTEIQATLADLYSEWENWN